MVEETKHEEEKADVVPEIEVNEGGERMHNRKDSHATITTNQEMKPYEPAPLDDDGDTIGTQFRLPTDMSIL